MAELFSLMLASASCKNWFMEEISRNAARLPIGLPYEIRRRRRRSGALEALRAVVPHLLPDACNLATGMWSFAECENTHQSHFQEKSSNISAEDFYRSQAKYTKRTHRLAPSKAAALELLRSTISGDASIVADTPTLYEIGR
ncbi:MAG: hypothetical protein ACREQR_13885 [Candidatus Binataceae bacterium]